MAVKFSTGLRDMLNGYEAVPIAYSEGIGGGNLAYVEGGAGVDTITDDANGFIDAGFAPGMKCWTFESTNAANDIEGIRLTAVTAGVLTFAAGTLTASEAFAAATAIVAAGGGSLKDIMRDGKLLIFTGSVPSSADAGQGTSTLLLTITESAGTWVAGAFDNGLEFENDPTDGVVEKASDETWQGEAVATGIAGWFMFVANATDALSSSTTLPRIIGSVGLSGSDLVTASTTITSGRTYTIDEFSFTLPAYYGA